jgi:selenocysteine lyase/cysteine desulfurase
MNSDQENALGAQIACLLNQGAHEINAQTAAKLLEARKEALAHFQGAPSRVWMPAWATEAVGRITEPYNRNLRAGLVLLAFLASVACVVAWQSMSQQGSELAEVDEALLTDELPINAYLDKGFDSWLKRP